MQPLGEGAWGRGGLCQEEPGMLVLLFGYSLAM